MSRTPAGAGDARAWAIGAGAVVVTLLALVAIGRGSRSDRPLDPRSDERLGTSALVALAGELGADVTVDDRFPDLDAAQVPDVIVLFSDRLGDGQRTQLDAWIDGGGRLLVTDPVSEYAPPIVDEFSDVVELEPSSRMRARCEIGALDGIDVGAVEPRNGGVLFDAAGRDSCVTDGSGGAYVVADERGAGTVVTVGGSGLVVNAALAEGQNAAVVAALVAPSAGTDVLVLAPDALAGGASGSRTLADLVPDGVTRGLVQLGIAFVLYAAWRARRLGRPVTEPRPPALAGSELVAAVGTLLDRSGNPGHAADLLRADLRRFLGEHLGLPPDTDAETLARIAADRTPAHHDALLWALTAPVHDDDGLVWLASTIDRIRLEVLSHV